MCCYERSKPHSIRVAFHCVCPIAACTVLRFEKTQSDNQNRMCDITTAPKTTEGLWSDPLKQRLNDYKNAAVYWLEMPFLYLHFLESPCLYFSQYFWKPSSINRTHAISFVSSLMRRAIRLSIYRAPSRWGEKSTHFSAGHFLFLQQRAIFFPAKMTFCASAARRISVLRLQSWECMACRTRPSWRGMILADG